MKNILFCCGAGISSGIIAKNVRKAAKKNKLDYKVKAVSQSEIIDYLPSTDLLMVGPHYEAEIDLFEEKCKPFGLNPILIPKDLYGTLDGEGILEIIKDNLGEWLWKNFNTH